MTTEKPDRFAEKARKILGCVGGPTGYKSLVPDVSQALREAAADAFAEASKMVPWEYGMEMRGKAAALREGRP